MRTAPRDTGSMNTHPATCIPCSRCGAVLPVEPDGGVFCVKCAQQSIWQKTWSVFAPSMNADDRLWWKRAAMAGYFIVMGYISFILIYGWESGCYYGTGIAELPGVLFVGLLFVAPIYSVPAVIAAFVVHRFMPESRRSRLILGALALAASWIVPALWLLKC
ncbi:hypothetical protein ACFL6C_01930 [Myxococcota bacterium]